MSDRLPGGITDVSVNPLLSAGTTSTRKPIILGVGDVKVLISNERIIRSTTVSDSTTNTVYGSSSTYQQANIIKIGNTKNSADYNKTTDYTINGSGDIDWTAAATEPTSGSEYFVTYYKTISNFSITQYTAESSIKAAHGDTYFSATKQFATATAVASGAPTTTFSWGNSETIDTPTDWTIKFTSGLNTGLTRDVSTYSTGEFTVSPAFPNSITVDDIFLVENDSPTVNMLTAGSILALRNGAQSTMVAQLDNTAFTNTLAPSGSEYSTSLNTHLETLKSDIDLPYFLVPMLPHNSVTFANNASAQTNAINPVWNHCKLMSAPENKGERSCIAGFLAGTALADFKAFGPAYFSTRFVAIAPGDLEFNDAAGQTLNGSIGAAAWAGKYCSKVDFTSLLNEVLVGITIATNFYNPIQQRELTGKGIAFLISDAGITKVVASKTTDVTSADTEDPAVVSIADYLKKVTRETLTNTFVGKPMNDNLLGAISGKLSRLFEQAIYDEVISAYNPASITVQQSSTEPRLIQVTGSVSPMYTNWFIDIGLEFYV